MREGFQTGDSVAAAEVRSLQGRVLASRHFASSARRSRFVSLLCDFYLEGRAAQLTEFVIGCEVFGRDSQFNPAEDPCVRVCAHEVRKKLAAYFGEEGRKETLVLEIPLGGYQPVFTRREITVAAPAPAQATPGRVPWLRWLLLAAALLMVAGAAATLALWQRQEQVDRVWKAFMDTSSPALIVLSNPAGFGFLSPWEPSPSRDRSVSLTPAQMAQLAPTPAIKWHFLPVLVPHDLTGMGEAVSLYQVGRYFDAKQHGILIKQSRTTTAEDMKGHNAVVLGGPLSNRWAVQPASADFEMADHYIINHRPGPGERGEYRLSGPPQTTITDYALVTVAPGLAPGHVTMMLMGIRGEGCQAAAEFITGKWYLQELQRRLDALPGGAPFFQALLQVETNDRIPTRITLIAVHPLKAAGL